MPKKEEKKSDKKPVIKSTQTSQASSRTPLTMGQKSADAIAKWAGSWTFIIAFLLIVAAWIFINGYYIMKYVQGNPFDPFPFILLNLALSLLAAIQAPVILMSQNRAAERDRQRAEYDYAVNRKAEREIQDLKKHLGRIERKLDK